MPAIPGRLARLTLLRRAAAAFARATAKKRPAPPPRRTPADGPRGAVLFVSRQRLAGAVNGSSAYLLDLAGAVRRAGFTPHLIQPSPDMMGRWPIMRLGPELAVFESHAIRGVVKLGRWVLLPDPRVLRDAGWALTCRLLRRLGINHPLLADRPRPYAIARPWTARDHAFVGRAGGQPDAIVADYVFQAEAFRIFPGRPGAVVMHDLFHTRDGGKGIDSVASLSREQEIAMLARADAVIAIQADEADFVRSFVPGPDPLLTPMAVHPVPAPQPGEDDTLLFVGSNTAPNVVGLRWFFDEVWPKVRALRPEARLDIAGSVASAFPAGGPPGVRFHGLVRDLAPLYARAGVVISPLTFGSGLKIKLVEALAHGKAVVATSITLQGIAASCTRAIRVADEPAHFAKAIAALATAETRAPLARSALDAAVDHFSPHACHGAFIAWLETRATPKGDVT